MHVTQLKLLDIHIVIFMEIFHLAIICILFQDHRMHDRSRILAYVSFFEV